MAESLRFTVPPSQAGAPLLGFILGSGQVAHDEVGRIMKLGGVFVNRRRVKEPILPLKGGDRIEIHLSSLTLRETAVGQIPLSILYEGPEAVIVNKPPGIPVSSTRQSDRGHLLSTLQAEIDRRPKGSLPHPPKARLVHRLDREASGAIVFALSREAAAHLSLQIQRHDAQRTYLAIALGHPDAEAGVLRHSLIKGAVVAPGEGDEALSAFRVLSRGPEASLIALTLQTGRLHQLRAQLSAEGWPIYRDRRYGRAAAGPGGAAGASEKDTPWLGLHAWRLRIRDPSSEQEVAVTAPPHADFLSSLEPLGLTMPDEGAAFVDPQSPGDPA